MTTRNQPTYDFLSGANDPPPAQSFRETLRQAQVVVPDSSNEKLRAEINTLKYELDSLKQERELTTLRHQQELQELQTKSYAELAKARASSKSTSTLQAKHDALLRDIQETTDRFTNERSELERKLRQSTDRTRDLTTENEELQTELSTLERQSKYRLNEVETRFAALQTSYDELKGDFDGKVEVLQATQRELARKEEEVGAMEVEVLKMKALAGDADTLAVIKRELSEQVTHIQQLEKINREQSAELKGYRKHHRSVEVVEEEKRVLEGKVRMMEELRRELGEARLQKGILEEERRSWSAYLESESAEGLVFESPEDMARQFVKERIDKLGLVEQLGRVQPELSAKDETIKALEEEKDKLHEELEKFKAAPTAAPPDAKARARLERQRNLAVKESEYLRAQLKALDEEEQEFNADKVDAQKLARIEELERLVDQYRSELQSLHESLTKLESQPTAPLQQQPTTGSKRRLSEDSAESERYGDLLRKNRTLQTDLDKLQSANTLLQADLKALTSQLSALKASSKTRILEFRNNPTTTHEHWKQSTILTLREENAALLSQLEAKSSSSSSGGKPPKQVPYASLTAAQTQIDELKHIITEKDKRLKRTKEIFAAKAMEFKEAVASILGWKFDFMPNGRVRVKSMFHVQSASKRKKRSNGDPESEDEEEEDDDEKNSIVFDGENGTMKVSGGPQSEFAREIRELITFWVEGRKDIPCFLAAMTLEFFDRMTKAGRLM